MVTAADAAEDPSSGALTAPKLVIHCGGLTKVADHIYFNSPSQIARHLPVGAPGSVEVNFSAFENLQGGSAADARAMGRDAGQELKRKGGPNFFSS